MDISQIVGKRNVSQSDFQAFHDAYYRWIAENKIDIQTLSGLKVERSDLHPRLFEYQKDAVLWALRIGHGLLAERFGLGKTTQQIEILRQVHRSVGGAQLVICPLGVRQQFTHEDGPAMGVQFTYVRTDAEASKALETSPFLITNYERVRDGGITANWLTANVTGVCMDEAAILGNLGTKTQDQFQLIFDGIQYKWAATATPAPNDYRQLIYFGDFFDEMDDGQALTRWFGRNPDKAGDLQLLPNMEQEFWMWVSSWALFIEKPSDLSSAYSDDGFEMPELNIVWHRLTSDHTKAWDIVDNSGQHFLLKDTTAGVTQAAREKRDSMDIRISELMKVALQLSNTEQTFSNRGNDENGTGAQQRVLRGEQRERKSSVAEVLPREQGKNRQGSKKGVHGGIPENVPTAEADARGNGNQESETQRAIRQRSGIQGESENASQREWAEASFDETQWQAASGVRDNASGLRFDSGETERMLCDLRSIGEQSESSESAQALLRGSRSRDGQGARVALPTLQLWNRALSGQPGEAASGGGLPRQFLVWCHLNDEQRNIEKALENAGIATSSVYGSLDIDETEKRLFAWKRRETQAFLAKPQQMGNGINMQQCSDAIYVGLNFKFRDFIQSVHRIHRYGQDKPVTIHIVHTDAEDAVRDALIRKWKQHDALMERMRDIVHEFGLIRESLVSGLRRSIGVSRHETNGAAWHVVNNDTVLESFMLPDESIDAIVTSIPFGNHYEYSANRNDFGFNPTDDVFWKQMDFLIPSLFRALKPGRMAAIHVKDRLLYGHQTPHGMMEVDYFSDDCNRAFRKHGFVSYGRITIPTDVVRENNSTNRLGWTENSKDSTKMGVGMPEYVLLFRKPQTDKSRSYADEPVRKDKQVYTRARWQTDAHQLWRTDGVSIGEIPPMLTQDDINGMDGSMMYRWWRNRMRAGVPYNHEEHVRLCEMVGARLPSKFMLFPTIVAEGEDEYVWTDILFMRTLNMANARRRLAKHVCPFPMDIPRRLVVRYSNPGDVILDPFNGLGTVPYVALQEGRQAIGFELNQDYYRISCNYLTEQETILTGTLSLFDMTQFEAGAKQDDGDDLADFEFEAELAMAAD